MEEYTAAVCNDIHYPFHDSRATGLFVDVVTVVQPDHIFINGDAMDFYDLSRFSKDPIRKYKLQEELDLCHQFLQELRTACPNAWIDFLEGNHEDRLTRFIRDNDAISSLRDLSIPRQLGLRELEISHHPYGETVWCGDMLVEHGDAVNKHSAYTAKNMLDKRGHSGISGHTHRMGIHHKSKTGIVQAWVENGCLCDLSPEYAKGAPDWQQGFCLVHMWDGKIHFEPIQIHEGECAFAGKIWTHEG